MMFGIMILMALLGLSLQTEFQLISPDIVKVVHLATNLLEVHPLRYEQGKKFTYYLNGNLTSNGGTFLTDESGSVVINFPLVEYMNYTINFKINGLKNGYSICAGIASEGYLIQQVLQGSDEYYLKGFCSQNKKANQYEDLFTNYNDFEETPEILEEVEEDTLFESIMMSLQGNDLIFYDTENRELIASFHQLDRRRVYLPVFVVKKLTPKKSHRRKRRTKKVAKEKIEEIIEEVESDSSGSDEDDQFLQIDFENYILLQTHQSLDMGEEGEPDLNDPPSVQPEYTIFEILGISSRGDSTNNAKPLIIPLRDSIEVMENNTLRQQNMLLPVPLQAYESCSYAYLDVPPFDHTSNIFLQVSIVQLDESVIGMGVFATAMLDQLRGWRNAKSQIWCLQQFQFGSLFRTDGTLYDSQVMGEYNAYRIKSSKIQVISFYFTKGNRVIYRIGQSNQLHLTCVNSKFKRYTALFEFKAWRGQPTLRVDAYQEHHSMPFEFSDSDRQLFEHFGDQEVGWNLLSNFYTDRRGQYNDSSDDFTLTGLGGMASMSMWDTNLYMDCYEWYVSVDELASNITTQICIGVHQIGQEGLIDQILVKNYSAQVAYLCDKNEFAHTFFQECPIYENTIKFARGTVLRFRLSEFLMEVYDGSNTVFFSLRRAGNTAVVPSVIMRGVNNRVTFLRKPPNPFQQQMESNLNREVDPVSYDMFTPVRLKRNDMPSDYSQIDHQSYNNKY